MSEFPSAYADTRTRLCAFISGLDDPQLRAVAPATPGWNVKDLLGHVVGIAQDMVNGNVAEAGQPGWTAAQVQARKSRSVEEIIEEWDELTPQIEAILDSLHPAVAGLTLADLVTHEHDVRGALGDRGGRDTEALALAVDCYVRTAGRAIKKSGLPALRVESEAKGWTIGEGEPVTTLRSDDFGLLRAISGRRSREQVHAYAWQGDPEPYLERFSLYGYRSEPLEE